MDSEKQAFQDLIGPENHCHGCGVGNPRGLYLKSYWDGDEAVAVWKPAPHHTAGSAAYVNGGILASLIDCHSNNLAMASSYRRVGRPVGSEPKIWCVTARLNIDYKKPVPIDQEIHLRARVLEHERRKTRVECQLGTETEVCALGEVLLIEIDRNM